MAKKVYIGKGKFTPRTLPSGYTQVEYIESSGNQYINTGYVATSENYRIKCKFKTINNETSTVPFGGGASTDIISALLESTTRLKFYVGDGSVSGAATTFTQGEYCELECHANNGTLTVTLNGTTNSGSYSGQINKVYPLYIFANNSSGTATQFSSIRFSEFQIYDNGTLVRDFVPCKNSSGTVGLYDVKNSSFYTNAGSGSFTAGSSDNTSVARKVKKIYVGTTQTLPSGYTQVAYLGNILDEYIDTGYKPNSNTRIVMDVEILNGISNTFLFGSRHNTSANSTSYSFTMVQLGGESLRSDYGSEESSIAMNPVQRLKIDKNKNVTIINGTTVATATAQTFQSSYTLALLSVNTAGTFSEFSITSRLYSCQIYDNGTMVRNFVPCKNSSNEVGLYDLVNGQFYSNKGSGAFTAGSTVTSTVVENIARKVKKGYVGIGGVARPFWGGGELAYYGPITSLNQVRSNLAATSVGNYALFGGGCKYANGYYPSANVDTYNKSLTHGTATNLSAERQKLAATSVGNYALFGGGDKETQSKSEMNIVDAYNTSLTRTTPTALSASVKNLAATTVGNYAVFGGGTLASNSRTNNMTAYDTSLTRNTSPYLSTPRSDLAATTVGNYALFGGGYVNSRTGSTNIVDAYNTSLTSSRPTALSEVRDALAATTVGNYALFAGGDGPTATVDAYNSSLTRIIASPLNEIQLELSATTVGDHALFGCGGRCVSAGSGYAVYGSTVMTGYDASLTRTVPTPLGIESYQGAATTIGDYALFGCGSGGTANVYAYTA